MALAFVARFRPDPYLKNTGFRTTSQSLLLKMSMESLAGNVHAFGPLAGPTKLLASKTRFLAWFGTRLMASLMLVQAAPSVPRGLSMASRSESYSAGITPEQVRWEVVVIHLPWGDEKSLLFPIPAEEHARLKQHIVAHYAILL